MRMRAHTHTRARACMCVCINAGNTYGNIYVAKRLKKVAVFLEAILGQSHFLRGNLNSRDRLLQFN